MFELHKLPNKCFVFYDMFGSTYIVDGHRLMGWFFHAVEPNDAYRVYKERQYVNVPKIYIDTDADMDNVIGFYLCDGFNVGARYYRSISSMSNDIGSNEYCLMRMD